MKSPESPSLSRTEDVGVKIALQQKLSHKEESLQDHNTERQYLPKSKRYSTNKLQNHTFLDTKPKKSFDKYSFTDNCDSKAHSQEQPKRINKEGEQKKVYQFSSKRVLPAIGCTYTETDNTRTRRQKSPLNALQDSSNHPEDNDDIENHADNKENTHHAIINDEVDRLKEEYRRMEQKLKDSEASEERWRAEAEKWKLLAVMDRSTDDDPRSNPSCSLLDSHEGVTSPVPNADISPRISFPSFQLHKCEPPDINGDLSKPEDNRNVNGSHAVIDKEKVGRNNLKDNVKNHPFRFPGSTKFDFSSTNNKHNQNFGGNNYGTFHLNDYETIHAKDAVCPAESSLHPWELGSHIIAKDHLNKQAFRFSDSTSDFFQDTLFDVQTNNAISSDRFQSQANLFNFQSSYDESEMEILDLSVSDTPFSSYRSNETEDANDHHNGNNNNTIVLRLNIEL